MKEWHFLYKNIYVSLLLSSIVCQRQRQMAILTHNFFSWSYHVLLSSRPYVRSFPMRGSQQEATCEPLATCQLWFSICSLQDPDDCCKTENGRFVRRCLSEVPSHSLALSVTDRNRLTPNWVWPYLMWASAYIIPQRPHFSPKQLAQRSICNMSGQDNETSHG